MTDKCTPTQVADMADDIEHVWIEWVDQETSDLAEAAVDALRKLYAHLEPEGAIERENDRANDRAMSDPMNNIPWGTPDSWIPDNYDDNGMRDSDFI